ncbi:MAG: hypothetical protein SWH54_09920 [Thermodesulfobacteriota bacterium]|nr:hypothetical protein [Thermodesulfobacteriota bacterium]
MSISTPTTKKAFLSLLLLLCAGTVIFSCAPKVKHYPVINQHLSNQNYEQALKVIKDHKGDYPKRNAALYYMEEGILAHFALRYKESNESLSRAEQIMDELYTRSISKQTASFFINDNTIPYRGEDFESAMVNLFMALNYVGLGLRDEALVEARKVDNKLNIINSRYPEDKKNVYKEDAFIRFLMGVLYEADSEDNDAFISYRKSEEIYRTDYQQNYGVLPPVLLIENLLSSAKAMDFEVELAEIQTQYSNVAFMPPAQKREMAEIYLIHYNGLGPEKVERRWVVPLPDAYVVKIAYPKFKKRNYQIVRGVTTLKNITSGMSYEFSTILMEHIGSIAVKNLDNRTGRIKAKAIARATTKYLATKASSRAAKREGGALAGLLVQVAGNVASAATEQADTRHWRLLPAEIRVGKLAVPPGEYEGKINFVNASGSIISSRKIEPFTVDRGEKRFMTHRTLN